MSELYRRHTRKYFGQSFLHNAGVTHRILHAIHAREGQRLLEIDPDQGVLTEGLLGNGAHLDVIELGQDLVPLLKLRFGLESRFSLHQGDVLKFNFALLVESDEELRMTGNLPYNISTPLIFHLLGHAPMIESMHFMLQKKVVERLMAAPGGGDWSRLSVMVRHHCRVKHLFNVGPGAFNPLPKVDSVIIHLTSFAEPPHSAHDLKLLERVVREAFNQRRKILCNTLKPLLSVKNIEAAEIGPILRPE